jgi:hypothetical protein
VIALMKAVLLFGAALGPDDAPFVSERSIQDEALADLERRVGDSGIAEEKPERKQQEDPRPQRPQEPLEHPAEASERPWIDFDWLELYARVGMAKFSKTYHINMSPAVAIEGRAPITIIAPADNPDGDYFGLFSELDVAIIKRTIQPQVAKPSGAMIALTVGADYTIFRNASWLVLVRGGIQYATYGGVTDLHDGIAPVVGLTGGVTITKGVAITVSPSYILGKKDSIILGLVGVEIDF